MNRRHFIIKAGTAFPVLAGAVYLVGCDSASSDDGNNNNNGSPQILSVGSSFDSGHSHSAEIPLTDLDSTASKTYDTSNSSGHLHMVTLSASQLETIKTGGSVTAQSTNNSGHSHQFSFKLT